MWLAGARAAESGPCRGVEQSLVSAQGPAEVTDCRWTRQQLGDPLL